MKSQRILVFFLAIMAALIVAALVFPDQLEDLLNRPAMYRHVLFVHVVAATLFFANAVIGILWESRSLAAGSAGAVLHTYRTVTWLDARFSSPLIIVSLIGGIMLSIILGDFWQTGWLSLAFLLFVLSGVVWVVSDIPTQYKIKKLMADHDPGAEWLPDELMRLLKMRLWISMAGVIPLLVVLILMVYKPEIVPVGAWFG
jgi:uncharacterized membrane protein